MSTHGRRWTFSGRFVPFEDAEWRSQLSTRETPEDLLIAREDADEEDAAMAEQEEAVLRAMGAEKLRACLERIPTREALALTLHLGLFGHPPHYQADIAAILDVRSQQVVSYMVRRARTRILYLATRPTIDFAALARALNPVQIEIVRLMYETASYTEAGRRRYPCPPEKRAAFTHRQWHDWQRNRGSKIKVAFSRVLAKLDRVGDAQAPALRHITEHLGILDYAWGKGVGRWDRR